MEVTKKDLETIYEKFITDPDWKIVEALILQFTEKRRLLSSIDTKGRTADEVLAMVIGYQAVTDDLDRFLAETKLIESAVTNRPTNWR